PHFVVTNGTRRASCCCAWLDQSVDAGVSERGSRGAKRGGNLWVLRSESRQPVRPPRKLHRLRTAKPASNHAEIDCLIETRATRKTGAVSVCYNEMRNVPIIHYSFNT